MSTGMILTFLSAVPGTVHWHHASRWEQFIGLCEAIDGAHSQPSFINLALALVQGVMHFLHTGDAIAAVKGDDILQENLISIFEHID
jgi:hypothetical protein